MTKKGVPWAVAGTVAAVVLAIFLTPYTRALVRGVIDSFGGSSERPVPIQSADLSGTGPGSLVSATTMPTIRREIHSDRTDAARVVYRSTSPDGQSTVVSGSVFIPKGDPPAGGWPVVSYGHGTTGLDEPCAPSLSTSLLGFADSVSTLIGKGYAVALADYQGLGAPGVHPYGDSRTAGLNMIDAVRALRATFNGVSKRWAAFGGSQGGGAAWAADEQARTYAPELEFVGAVAVSPMADMVGLVDEARQGALTVDESGMLAALVESLARLHADINRDDYRRAAAAKYWDAVVACSGSTVLERADAGKAFESGDIHAGTTQAADRLRHYLSQWALPQQRLSAPLYVWYGGKDTIVDASWIAGAISRACALGGTVTVQFEKNKGHGEVNYSDQWQWLADRFGERPVTNDCP